MPGQRGTEKRALPGQVLVRLTVEADAAVDAHAAAAGLTRAAWARDVIANAAALPVDDRRPVRAHVRQVAPAEDVAAIGRLSAWLNRCNGALMVLSQDVRERGADNSELERILSSQDSAAVELARIVARLRELDEMPLVPGG